MVTNEKTIYSKRIFKTIRVMKNSTNTQVANNETQENNRLLAEFLGYVNTTPTDKDFNIYELKSGKLGRFIEAMSMKFHNDWNWLMEVVEKIETAETKDGRTFTIGMHRDSVLIFEYGLTTNEIVFTEGKGRLENLYNACIAFVKWYNENN